MAHKGLSEPHVLLASSNPQRLMKNLVGILATPQLKKIDVAVCEEAKLLYQLGNDHYIFAKSLDATEWRQKISRFYYAAYNVKRAVSLRNDGSFSTESKDHQTVDVLPPTLRNHSTYSGRLRNLREDRNLADYSHIAKERDLVISVENAGILLEEFMADAKVFLVSKGVAL